MSSRPSKQLFSSELIYQLLNSVKYYNEQVRVFQVYLPKGVDKLQKSSEVPSNKVSDFFFIQRQWPPIGSKEDVKSGFTFLYYSVTNFTGVRLYEKGSEEYNKRRRHGDIPEIAKPRLRGILDSFTLYREEWDNFLSYLKLQNRSRAVMESVDWVNSLRARLRSGEQPEKDNRLPVELHHHLLQLYSRFGTRDYIPGALHKQMSEHREKEIPAAAYYVTLVRDGNERSYPPLNIWKLRRSELEKKLKTGEQEKKPRGGAQERQGVRVDQVDTVATTQDPRVSKATSLFTQYLVPLFNEPDFDGSRFQVPKDSSIKHMIWLPLYDECVSGRFRGYLRGWLFQVLPGDPKDKDMDFFEPGNDTVLTHSAYWRLQEYITRCLDLSNTLSLDVNRHMVRELLQQEIREKKCYEVLAGNITLLGGWKSVEVLSPTQDPGGDDFGDFVPLLKYLHVNLDPPVLEKDSGNFIQLKEIDEEHKILRLNFGHDFRHPDDNDSEYYNRLVNQIYVLYTRLKNARWAELQSQKYENTRLSNSLAHGLKNSFSVVIHLIEDNAGPINALSEPFKEIKRDLGMNVERLIERALAEGVESREHITLTSILEHYGLKETRHENKIALLIESSERAKLIQAFSQETFRRIQATYSKVPGTHENKIKPKLGHVLVRGLTSACVIFFTGSQPRKWEKGIGVNERRVYGDPPTRPVLVYNSVPFSIEMTDFEVLVTAGGRLFAQSPEVTSLVTSIDDLLHNKFDRAADALADPKGHYLLDVERPAILAYIFEELFLNCLKWTPRDERFGTAALSLDVEHVADGFYAFSLKCSMQGELENPADAVARMRERSLREGGLASCNQFLRKYSLRNHSQVPLDIEHVVEEGRDYMRISFVINPSKFSDGEASNVHRPS
jgi:hypothetical protein